MRIQIEVRAYVVDDYGHPYLMQKLEPDQLNAMRKGHEDAEGFPRYYTVIAAPTIETFPLVPVPVDPFGR